MARALFLEKRGGTPIFVFSPDPPGHPKRGVIIRCEKQSLSFVTEDKIKIKKIRVPKNK